ncbi:LADA_0H08680g1_1 [Lachancea dasiensis]|uniref:LADA_0H08680g1_1 n=1 Tax=Lachancea dasiensis TaxID=1072105 RepID=A0A1G4K2J0_9SACH|nr:LADA_0H08680g1_1 [Lachancea dasiensis]
MVDMASQRPSPHLIKSSSSSEEYLSRNRPNTVLSTSFVSARKLDEAPSSPLSPQNTRRKRSGTVKTINNLKHDIHHVQQDLARLRRSKEDVEKRRESATNDIYPGNYSQEHLQRHSMALQSKDQLRKLDQQIKKSGDLLSTLRRRLDSTSSSASGETRFNAIPRPQFFVRKSQATSESALANDSVTEEEEVDEEFLSDSPSDSGDTSAEFYSGAQTKSHSHSSSPRNPAGRDAKVSKEHATWLVSDYLQSLQDTNSDRSFILSKANDLVTLLEQNPTIKFDLVLPAFSSTIQQLLLSEDEVTVSAAYRICRYLITGPEFIQELRKLYLEAFVIASLTKAGQSHTERLQAFKLVRSFLEYDMGLSVGLTQSVISCIENTDDPLRDLAMETLLELCYLKPALVHRCNGIQVLQNFVAENPASAISSFVLDALLDLMTFPDTRKYFVNCFDISVTLATLSDSHVKLNTSTEKLQSSISLISKCLKNYNGLIIFSANNFQRFRELLAFFRSPTLARYLIDLFLDVLRIKPLPYMDKKKAPLGFKPVPSQFQVEIMPINQYVGLLAIILFKLNFVTYLIPLVGQRGDVKKDPTLAAKARYLITEYSSVSVNLAGLRPSAPSNLHFPEKMTVEAVLYQAFQYERMTKRLNRNRNTIGMTGLDSNHGIMEFSERSKHKALISNIDEVRFKRMVYDTKVLQTKDFTLWNWGTLSDLIEGPLLNPRRLEELAKGTKFFRRLLVFYRPMRYRFSRIRSTSRLAARCVHVGCQLFKTLTATSEGMRILYDDTKLLPQMASLLFKAMEGQLAGNVFSEDSLSNTVCSGYFKFLGTLSDSSRGCAVLEKWSVFTVIYKMFQRTSTLSTAYLLRILPELSIIHSNHSRTILGKALVHPLADVRVEATNQLGIKLQSLLSEAKLGRSLGELERFLIELLIRQLYDLSSTVVAAADKILYDYCALQDWPPNVDTPRHHLLNQLVFIRSPILLEFLKTPAGFKQLNEIGFLASEREKWLRTKNMEYVPRVEAFIQHEMMAFPNAVESNSIPKRKLPMHFCGSLASTEEGINLISQMGDFVAIVNTIKKYRHDGYLSASVEQHSEVKAALWCCGYIGSTAQGINLLDAYSIGGDIVCISIMAQSTSVKFTAFYVLGLIASTEEGCEILDELGWDCSLDVQEEPVGLAFPRDVEQFLQFRDGGEAREFLSSPSQDDMESEESIAFELPNMDLDRLLNSKAKIENTTDDHEGEFQAEVDRQTRVLQMYQPPIKRPNDTDTADKVTRAASRLNNHIFSSAAVKEITELKSTYGAARFETVDVLSKVLELMEQYRFKPQARKILCENFLNRSSFEAVIKKDKKKSRR